MTQKQRVQPTPPLDDPRLKLRELHSWLMAQDPSMLAALAEARAETRKALSDIERWFKNYAAAFNRRTS